MDKDRKVRLMIVEDEEGARKAVAKILESLGYDVAEAEDADKALGIFGDGKGFDIVLTDLSLPGMSGWDLCKAINKINPDVRVAILTGWDIEEDDERIAGSGVSEVLAKPINMQKMKEAIKRMLS